MYKNKYEEIFMDKYTGEIKYGNLNYENQISNILNFELKFITVIYANEFDNIKY